MINWIKQAYADLVDWLQAILQAVFDFFSDIGILVMDGILSAIASIIEAVPVPDFMSNGLQGLMSGLSPDIAYFLAQSGFPEAIALIGAGYLFRFTRKVVTLFQW